jgi:hypothetical protein
MLVWGWVLRPVHAGKKSRAAAVRCDPANESIVEQRRFSAAQSDKINPGFSPDGTRFLPGYPNKLYSRRGSQPAPKAN